MLRFPAEIGLRVSRIRLATSVSADDLKSAAISKRASDSSMISRVWCTHD